MLDAIRSVPPLPAPEVSVMVPPEVDRLLMVLL